MKKQWERSGFVANGRISLVREGLPSGDDRQEPQPTGANLRQGSPLLGVNCVDCEKLRTSTPRDTQDLLRTGHLSTECVDRGEKDYTSTHHLET
jgi:hypothetical protein